MVESSQRSVKNEGLPRFKGMLADRLEPILNMEDIVRDNKERREAEEAAKKLKDELVKQTLYQQSLKIQKSVRNMQKNVLATALGIVGLSDVGPINIFDQKSPSGATGGLNLKFQNNAKPEQQTAEHSTTTSSKVLRKKVIMEDGTSKNFHVDYTGKMIYFDNQK